MHVHFSSCRILVFRGIVSYVNAYYSNYREKSWEPDKRLAIYSALSHWTGRRAGVILLGLSPKPEV